MWRQLWRIWLHKPHFSMTFPNRDILSWNLGKNLFARAACALYRSWGLEWGPGQKSVSVTLWSYQIVMLLRLPHLDAMSLSRVILNWRCRENPTPGKTDEEWFRYCFYSCNALNTTRKCKWLVLRTFPSHRSLFPSCEQLRDHCSMLQYAPKLLKWSCVSHD